MSTHVTEQAEPRRDAVDLVPEVDRRSIEARLCLAAIAGSLSSGAQALAEVFTVAHAAGGAHPWMVYAVAAAMSRDELEKLQLEHEALFMLGRIDIAGAIEAKAKRQRQSAGRKGGRPPTVADEQVRQAWAATCQADSSTNRRMQAARKLGLSEDQLSRRLRRLDEMT